MLPSMPLLFLSSADQEYEDTFAQISPQKLIGNDAPKRLKLSDNEDQRNVTEHNFLKSPECGGASFESLPIDYKKCDDELVLLADNSPLSEKRKQLLQNTGPKKKKKIELFPTLRTVDNSHNEKAEHLAEAYFMKVKSSLDKTLFEKFVTTLGTFNEETGSIVDLFKEVSEILNNFPELADDFVGFLLPHQALECRRFSDSLFFEKAWSFFRKADACHFTRILHFLEQHATNKTVSLEAIRSSILPLLKGHPSLMESFLSLIPQEKPAQSSLEHYEDITGNSGNEGDWERLRIPSHPDRGCGHNCNCPCHIATTRPMCISCNVKFANGRVYVQYGKILRFARVHFNGASTEEVLRRLHPAVYAKSCKRKSRSHKGTSNITQAGDPALESNKNNIDGLNLDIGDGDDIQIKQEHDDFGYFELTEGTEDDVIVIEDEDDYFDDYDKLSETSSGEGDKSLDSILGDHSEPFEELKSTDGSLKTDTCEFEEAEEQDVEEIAFDSPLKLDHLSDKENEPIKFECLSPKVELESSESSESTERNDESQTSASSSDVSIKSQLEVKEDSEEDESEQKPNKAEWTREEDKVILEAFQKELGTEQTFSKISGLMPSRSVLDIQGRFQVLMKLLEKVASGSHETCSS